MSVTSSAAGAVLPTAPDRRLVSRYGGAALAGGYAAIPHVVLRQRRALGITAAEWDYICELWSHWRSDALPCPSVQALATGLGVDQSTIRRYRASLEHRGLLRVTAVGARHRYDLTPLIEAAVGSARLQAGEAATDVPPTALGASAREGRADLHAKEEVERDFDLDSMPPYPPPHTALDTLRRRDTPPARKHPFPQGTSRVAGQAQATAQDAGRNGSATRTSVPCSRHSPP